MWPPSASRSLLQRRNLYGYRRGGTFESPKVPKSDLGLRPKDPLTAKLRLDTNDAKHRPYGAADTLSRCLRRILFWIQQEPN